MICYCDMDGIVADFVGGMCKDFKVLNPYLREDMLGVWDFTHLIPDYNVLGHEFWENLELMPDAHQIMNFLERHFKKIYFVTAPSDNAGCIPGKIAWAKRHFKYPVIPLREKELLAKPGTFLLDDKDENVEKFRQARGHSFLFPRIWNSKHNERHQAISHLSHYLRLVMYKFVVGFISFFDNELELEIVEAADWRDAVCKHSKSHFSLVETDGKILCPDDPESMKTEVFSQDCMMSFILL